MHLALRPADGKIMGGCFVGVDFGTHIVQNFGRGDWSPAVRMLDHGSWYDIMICHGDTP